MQIVSSDTSVKNLNANEAVGGEGEVGAQLAVEAGQEEGTPDVREKPDGSFGHGEDGALRRDAEGRVHAQPDAAAHRDAVHQRDVGFRVGGDQVVELVFQREVVFGLLLP